MASLSCPSEVCTASSSATASVTPSSAASKLSSSVTSVLPSSATSVSPFVSSVTPSAPVPLLLSGSSVDALFPDSSPFSSPFTAGAGISGSAACGSSTSAVSCAESACSSSTAATAAVPDASAFSAARACMLFIGIQADTIMIADIIIAVICFLFIVASLYFMFTKDFGYIIPIYILPPILFYALPDLLDRWLWVVFAQSRAIAYRDRRVTL